MRHFILSGVIILFISTLALAQVESGAIKYKQTNYLKIEAPQGTMPSNIPNSMDIYTELLFNKTTSLYQKDPDYKETFDPNDNMPRMFRRWRQASYITYYKDTPSSTFLEETNLFGKDFLVSDDIPSFKWKVSAGEQKDILGYTCMKAYYQDSTYNIVAFFTPQIPLSHGPEKYNGLPGVILELQSASVHIMATEVNLKDVKIDKPKKGTKTTRADFEKIRDEKTKEQAEMWRGRGRGMHR